MNDKQKQTNRQEADRKSKFSWKNFWSKCGSFFHHLFTVNKGLKAVSVLIAVFIWLTVVLTTSTQITGTVSDVPVTIDLKDTAVGKLGLSVVDQSEEKVRVTLYGKRDDVRALTKHPEEIKVTGQLNRVNAAGTYEIDLMASLPLMADGVRVQNITPSSITVRFDTVEKKTVPVVVDYSSVKIDPELICMPAEPAVKEITLQGPAADLMKVQKAVARIDYHQKLDASKEFVVPLTLMDEKGVEVDASFITMEKAEIAVVLPVYKTKKVPLKVTFTGGMSEELLRKIPYTLSHSTIEIAGPPDKLDAVTELSLATINLTELSSGYQKEFDLQLPPGFVSIDNISKVSFTFKPEDWGEKTFSVRRFKVVNVPENVSAKVLTKVVYQVKVVGPDKVLSKLNADQLFCQVDLLDKSVASGKWNYAATVQIDDSLLAWAIGQYTITVQIQA